MTDLFDTPDYDEAVESDEWTAVQVTPIQESLSTVSGLVPDDALEREWVPVVTKRTAVLFRESEIAGFERRSP